MLQLDASMEIEVVDLFHGIYECDEKIAAIEETMKQYRDSKKEMIKNAAEKLDVPPLHVRRAYKEWVEEVTDPETVDSVSEIVFFLKDKVQKKI